MAKTTNNGNSTKSPAKTKAPSKGSGDKKDAGKAGANKLWGGHYSRGPAVLMQKINASIGFDKKLWLQDIEGSVAHCEMLIAQGIIPEKDGKRILDGMVRIREEFEERAFPLFEEYEDIHMNIEVGLTEKIGPAAKKLHTARSRNDQVATDFKLWVRDALDAVEFALKDLQAALLDRAEEYYDAVMPGFTHLQVAQPVTFGHHLMAYVEMFGRDRGRLMDARERLNECPLGSAALAGTSFPLDRHMVAETLGFREPTRNSLDSVSDRDFALEFLSAVSIIAMHLSRFAEEIVIWTSAQFKFITLTEAFTTGSSIMPQKRNPDAAELIRAKTGRINGSLITLLTVMKGLPLAYSKDMQEDKEPVFDAAENILLGIEAMAGMVRDMTPDRKRLYESAAEGFSTATDLADWLVKNLGLPFRDCHHIVGRVVKQAEEKGLRLDELTLKDLQKVEPKITAAALEVLTVKNSVKSRKSYGGTAPENVKKAIKVARKQYIGE
ncbi:MAG: argininosuccinate lyase [Proteobacteria bacterium]|nr:argininosuccinate lyase [Pseudomonadota bacterium]